MKTIIIALTLLCASAFSQVPTDKMLLNASCKKIENECKKAGFIAGAPDGKKLYADCFTLLVTNDKMLLAKSPKSVKVDNAILKDCKAAAEYKTIIKPIQLMKTYPKPPVKEKK